MRCLWTVALAGLAAALLVSISPALAGDAMRVRLVEGAAGCQPVCGEWISAEGEIRVETPSHFRKVLAKLNGRKLPVVIHSPGGRLSAALAIGRMIRSHGLAVTVQGTCTSACPFVLAGGVERQAAAGAVVGVHQALLIRSGSAEAKANGGGQKLLHNSKATAKQFRLMRGKLRAYLVEMGVSPELVNEMEKASPFEMNVLSAKRQAELNLVTADYSVTSSFDLAAQAARAPRTSSMEPLP